MEVTKSDPLGIQSYYDHDFEVCKPYYYAVWLQDHDINLEFTVSEKSSFYRIAWNKKGNKNLMLSVQTKGRISVVDRNTVEGYEIYEDRIKVYFYLKCEKSFISDSIWDSSDKSTSGITAPEGIKPAISLTFPLAEKETAGFKMGVSFVDQEQARKNLEKDIPDCRASRRSPRRNTGSPCNSSPAGIR